MGRLYTAPSDIFDIMYGIEINSVIIKIYVMSDIHRVKGVNM
jgi:hypothetical protein